VYFSSLPFGLFYDTSRYELSFLREVIQMKPLSYRSVFAGLCLSTLALATACNGGDDDMMEGPDASPGLIDASVDALGPTDASLDANVDASVPLRVELLDLQPRVTNSIPQPLVTGRASVGSRVTIHADGAQDAPCSGPAQADLGVIQATTPEERQSGIAAFSGLLVMQTPNMQRSIRALAVDSRGSSVCSESALPFLYDVQLPAAPSSLVTSPRDSGRTRQLSVTGTASDARGGEADLYFTTFPGRRCNTEGGGGVISGIPVNTNFGTFVATVVLPDRPGFYFLTAKVRDEAGNPGPCMDAGVSYQLLAP
jgi:hypothetical protein